MLLLDICYSPSLDAFCVSCHMSKKWEILESTSDSLKHLFTRIKLKFLVVTMITTLTLFKKCCESALIAKELPDRPREGARIPGSLAVCEHAMKEGF